MQISKLDQLNAALAGETALPQFRRMVDRSGRNLDFLRKKYRGTNPVIKELSQLSLMELLKPPAGVGA